MIYGIAHAIVKISFRILFRLETRNMDRLPLQGPVILCSNHISLFDPPVLGAPLKRRIYYMAKEELFKIPLLGWLIKHLGAFPVKRGGVSKESIRTALNLLAEGKMLGIFPEGTRNNQGAGKKGAAMLALRSDAVVVPAAIVGSYKPFSKVVLRFGHPIDMTSYREQGGSEAMEAATEKIMAAIQELKNEKD